MTASATYPLLSGSIPLIVDDSDADATPHDLEHEPDHVAKGVSRFIEQYKNKPRMEAWVTSYLLEIQAVEDAIYDVYTLRWLDNATGAQLSMLGQIVGQHNPGLSDADYKVLIRARIAVNRSNGKPDELIEILRLMAASTGANPILIELTENYPAAHVIQLISDIGTVDPDLIFDMLTQADAAGVELNFVFSYDPPGEQFQFSAGTTATDDDVSTGFGNTIDAGDGGKLASVRGPS